ncbi:MAG: hypothetical protein U0807_11005 [Candidatus Binatia bacterium]
MAPHADVDHVVAVGTLDLAGAAPAFDGSLRAKGTRIRVTGQTLELADATIDGTVTLDAAPRFSGSITAGRGSMRLGRRTPRCATSQSRVATSPPAAAAGAGRGGDHRPRRAARGLVAEDVCSRVTGPSSSRARSTQPCRDRPPRRRAPGCRRHRRQRVRGALRGTRRPPRGDGRGGGRARAARAAARCDRARPDPGPAPRSARHRRARVHAPRRHRTRRRAGRAGPDLEVAGASYTLTGGGRLGQRDVDLRLSLTGSRALTEDVVDGRRYLRVALTDDRGLLVVPLQVRGRLDHPTVTPDPRFVASVKQTVLANAGMDMLARKIGSGAADAVGGVVSGLLDAFGVHRRRH